MKMKTVKMAGLIFVVALLLFGGYRIFTGSPNESHITHSQSQVNFRNVNDRHRDFKNHIEPHDLKVLNDHRGIPNNAMAGVVIKTIVGYTSILLLIALAIFLKKRYFHTEPQKIPEQ